MCPIVASYDLVTDFAGQDDDSSQSGCDADRIVGHRTTYATEWPEHGVEHNRDPFSVYLLPNVNALVVAN